MIQVQAIPRLPKPQRSIQVKAIPTLQQQQQAVARVKTRPQATAQQQLAQQIQARAPLVTGAPQTTEQKTIFPKFMYKTKEQGEFENRLYRNYASPEALDKIKTNTTKSIKSIVNSINAEMPYKIIFLIAFFALFYNVIFNICIFFGIDIVLLNMYMGWVSFLLVLFTFLPTNYSDVFKKKDETV